MPALAAAVFSFCGHGNQAICCKYTDNMNQIPYTNYVYEVARLTSWVTESTWYFAGSNN